jgi:RNA polymerase sigma factor (sigma-70 family)
MTSCAGESRNAMWMRSSSWWTVIKRARTGLRARFWATRLTHATSRRTPSSGFTKRLGGSMEGRGFQPGFYRILVNLCIDHQRRNRWWRRVAPLANAGDDPDERAFDPPSSAAGPEGDAMRSESIGQLRPALDRLSPQQRAAVLLQSQEGFTSREIAAVLKCSEATARVHLHRGMMRLRKLLQND